MINYHLFFLLFVVIVKLIFNDLKSVQSLPITNVQNLKKVNYTFPSISSVDFKKTNIKFDNSELSVQILHEINNRYDCLAEELIVNLLITTIDYDYDHLTYLWHTCLQNIARQRKPLKAEILSSIKQLQQDFLLSLNPLSTNIEQLENRVHDLETVNSGRHLTLEGEAIIAPIGVEQNENNISNFVLGTRLRMNFMTSFSDNDELNFRLQGRNIPELEEVTGSKMANLGFDGEDEGDVEIDEITYIYTPSKNSAFGVYFLGAGLGDLIPTVNSLFSSSGEGAISTFGRENPIRRIVEGGAISWSKNLGDIFNLTVGYVDEGSNRSDQGLFQNSYGLISQLTFADDQRLSWSLTYGYIKNKIGTGTGSMIAENPFGDIDNTLAHSYGGELSYWLQPQVNLGARVGWIQARSKEPSGTYQADIFTWAFMLGIEDLFRENSLLGIIWGQPPKVLQNTLGKDFEDPDTSHHFEVFYRWEPVDNITITPGFFLVLNPEHSNQLGSIFVGTIRTTFEF